MIFTSLISLALLPALSKATLVPAANGPYSVALKTLELTDTSRFNDLNPENSTTVRRMMTSVFLPIEKDLTDKLCHREIVPLMTPAVAARYAKNLEDDGLPHIPFDSFQLEVCALSRNRTCVRGRGKKRYPVVLFSPGIGDSRLLYSAMARSLASNGYIVVTVDHTYEAYFVEFPDGTVTPGVKISNDTAFVQKVVAIRTADLSFVVNQLHNRTITSPLLSNFPGTIDLRKIAAFGHSMGGASVASLLRVDHRVLGGVNLDGPIIEPTKSLGLSKPFVLAGSSDATAIAAGWDQLWPKLRGPRMELRVNGTMHRSFTDGPLLMASLPIPDPIKKLLGGQLGSIEPRRIEGIINSIVISLLDLAFNKSALPLGTISEKFPEIRVTRSKLK